jgi:hypothetical protein
MSKGSSQRPMTVDHEIFSKNWSTIFEKRSQSEIIDELSKLIAEETLDETELGDEKNGC